jgi:hypothetical protein
MYLGAGAALAELSKNEKQQRAAHHEIELGLQAFKSKDLKRGIMHYERAYRLAPDHKVLYTIAKAYDKQSGKCRESLRTWERLMLRCDGCAIKAKVTQGTKAARQRCNVKVSIRAAIPGVDVYLDQDNYGAIPITTQLPAVPHKLELIKDGVSLYSGALALKPSSGERALSFVEEEGRLTLKRRVESTTTKPRKKKTKTKRYSKRSRKKSRKKSREKSREKSGKRPKTQKSSKIAKSGRLQKSSTQTSIVSKPQEVAPEDHKIKLKKAHASRQQINASLQCEFQSSEGYMAYPDCNGASLKEGDRFRVILSAPRGAYVYLFLNNSHGDRVMLFPDPNSDNHMRPGVEYVIPGSDWYTLDENGGTTENIKVIASKKPIPALEQARGMDLNTKALATIQKMSFRGVRKTVRPAKMSVRLKQLDTVISSEGSKDVASASFNIVHK